MSEETSSSAPTGVSEQPAADSAPVDKGKKKLWLMIAAVAVAILLIGSVAYVFVIPKDKLKAEISPSPVGVAAGAIKKLSVVVKWKGDVVDPKSDDLVYLWSVNPSSMGTFDRRSLAEVNLTAANAGGDGKVLCKVTYLKKTVTAEAVLTVAPPILDSVIIDPSTKTLAPNVPFKFNATALSSVAIPITTGITFTWSVTGMATGQYTLSATSGASVTFTGLVNGHANLTAQTTLGGVTKSGTSNITVGVIPPRSVGYRYYDWFNVPFGEWWDSRWATTHVEQVISYTYPTMFIWYSQPPGNIWYYTNMRLDVEGRNMSEINMNSNPEFLPFLGTARGGNAEINWLMQYITKAEMKRFPDATAGWEDGWVVSLNGTTTMDKQAAMAVLNVTSAGYDDFANWWTNNEPRIEQEYTDWLLYEGNVRLDIWAMYEYPLTPLAFDLSAQKVGDKIVLTYDIITWGMEALMTRWLHEAFTPTEAYFEGFTMNATIGPERANITIKTIVAYGIYAYETTLIPAGKTHGDPCWVFEIYPQDYVKPSIAHPKSDFTPYMPFYYDNQGPGSLWYGKAMPYDYTPGPHNLSENETLVIEYPTKNVMFKEQAYYPNGTPILDKGVNPPNPHLRTVNVTANMTCTYGEPMESDNTELDDFGSATPLVIDNVNGVLTFTGPIDMWTWSKDQTKHDFLKTEWDRMNMIPYGIPYMEFTWEATPPPLHPDHFDVSAMSSPVYAGEPVTFTVTVKDQDDHVFPSYNGTLNFTSTDAAAVLPGNYTFTVSDAGVHVFSNLTFMTAGTRNLLLVDAANSSVSGSKLGIVVNAAAVADRFVVSSIPNVVVINVAQDVTVTVYDQYDRLFVGYTGDIVFDSNRSSEVTLPPATPVPATQNYVTISGGVTFTALDWFLVYANDSVDNTITGQTTVQVVLSPPIIDHFVVTGETELAPGEYYDLTVTAVNQYGSTFQTYGGTVNFTTDAPAGTYVLPVNTTFALADNGVKVFTGAMKFSQMGTFEVNVSDTVTAAAYGLLTGINVAARPNIVYTVYDFFKEPWGEWYWNPKWRWTFYSQDYILSNTTGMYVQLYDPTKTGDQGVIYAPYRLSMNATNVSNVDVHHPAFMPVNETVGQQAGAEVSMHVRAQYLDQVWWWNYWVPQFGWNNAIYKAYMNNTNDGYLLGTVYDMELNREAAYEWMNMPTGDDPLTWWAANGANYKSWWDKWVNYEGNVRLDIYCGYEFKYGTEKLHMNMTVDSVDGDILLRVSTVTWGWDALIQRWLNDTGLCTHQAWFEDFDMDVTYGNGIANVSFDAAVQYGFHAVKANGSTGNDGAWVWEPAHLDYWPSWSQSPAYHPSEYDPYAGPSWPPGTTTFQGWNSGDPRFGGPTEYDYTPFTWDLNEFQTLIVKMPDGAVPGFWGEGVYSEGIRNLSIGITQDYDALRYTGTTSLGFVHTNETNPLARASYYDEDTRTLTFRGPYDFNNAGGRTGGILYHGAPWIEFNVTPLSTQSVIEATPEIGAESAPAVTAEMLSLAAVISGFLIAVPVLIGTRREDE